ncbi:hypothetical protein FKM82_029291 [Ascaphus truei]
MASVRRAPSLQMVSVQRNWIPAECQLTSPAHPSVPVCICDTLQCFQSASKPHIVQQCFRYKNRYPDQ